MDDAVPLAWGRFKTKSEDSGIGTRITTQPPDLLEDAGGDGLASRLVVLSILKEVLGRRQLLDPVLEKNTGFLSLSDKDRSFVRMMVSTVLRRKGQLEDIICRAAHKGELPRGESLRHILYLGLAQILFMDVPDHAAVDTSVKLAALAGLEGKKAYVNALLRRATREGKAWIASSLDHALLNIPSWLYTQWISAYGPSVARRVALSSLVEAPLDFSVKDPSLREMWAQVLDAEILLTGSLRCCRGGVVTKLRGYEEGAWWVQDASAALPALLFGDVKGRAVLDLCAAPGGKTLQLAAMGAHVTALDRSARRMTILVENIKRLKLEGQVHSVVSDAGEWTSHERFPFILLDAPCSATGTIRRHPDLLSLKDEKDQAALVQTQARLLRHAASDLLEEGGILLYCTCSLQTAEGEQQIDAFLAENKEMKRLPIRAAEIGGMADLLTRAGDVRILPCHCEDKGGMDGFYIARLQKSRFS